MTATADVVSLDALAHDVVRRSGFRFSVATTDADREAAYRLRRLATVRHGWAAPDDASPETDRYDARATHVVGWAAAEPIAAGRIVLPPGSLPTEDAWGIAVEPRGQVVDVGRMTVAPSWQSRQHAVFLALLAALYLDMRASGYGVACGAMSQRARSLVRLLGLDLEVIGPERAHLGEQRAPVRFTLMTSARRMVVDRR